MLKVLPLIVALFFALPTMAEPQNLTPEQVETLPFSTHGAGTPKTDTMMGEIDMSAEVEGAHGESAGLPQFNTSTFASQLFWLFITFSILYIFFTRSSLPKISAIMEDRMTTIKTDLEEADKLSTEAEDTRTAYEDAMGGAHDKARTYIAEAMAALRADAEKEANAFRERSEKEIRKLEGEAEKAKEKIKGDLAETAYSLTGDIINKLTDAKISDADIKKAVTSYMDTPTAKTTKKAA